MHTYVAKSFTLPEMDGVSQKQNEVHLGLYQGYVKHVNLLREQIADLTAMDPEKYAFALESVRRRLAFEFNGMRMHELYFSQWEGGPAVEPLGSALDQALTEKYGSWNDFIKHFRTVGMSRGPGWCSLAWDSIGETPHIWWTADLELGQLSDVKVLLTMDMWEHAYMVDYLPAEKAKHIDAFFKNVNWSIVEKRFADARV